MSRRLIAIFAVMPLVIAAVYLVDNLDDTGLVGAVGLVAIVCTIMAFTLAVLRDRQMPLFCDPLFIIFGFLSQFYVVGALGIHIWGHTRIPVLNLYASEYSVPIMSGFLLMLLSLVFAYRSEVNTVLAEKLTTFDWFQRRIPGTFGIWVLLLFYLGFCYAFIQYQGGLMAKLSMGYGRARPGGAVFTLAHTGLLVVTLMVAWLYLSKPRRGIFDHALFYGLLVFDVLFFGVVLSIRKYLFYLFFGILTILLLRKGRQALPKLRAAVLLALLLVFFGFWGTIRSTPLKDVLTGRQNPITADQLSGARAYLHGVAEPYGTACMVYGLFPEREPYRWGSTLNVTLLGFIPRAIWPDKPVGIGKELTKYLVGHFYEHTHGFSIATTIPADLYLNFGWSGFLVGGLLLGSACRLGTLYATKGMKNGIQTKAARVLLPAVFIMGLGEVRADMATMLAFYIMAFFPVVMILIFCDLDRYTTTSIADSES